MLYAFLTKEINFSGNEDIGRVPDVFLYSVYVTVDESSYLHSLFPF